MEDAALELPGAWPGDRFRTGDGGWAVKCAVPVLEECAAKSNKKLKEAADQAIIAIGRPGPADVSDLAKLLHDKRSEFRALAASTLGYIGPAAKETVFLLAEALGAGDIDLRRAAANALSKIGGNKSVVPALQQAINETDDELRLYAITALGKIGPDAEEAVGTLAGLLRNAKEEEQVRVLIALQRIGPSARKAVSSVRELLKSREKEVRMQSILTLGPIGPEAETATLDLVRVLASDEEEEATAAVKALAKIGKRAVPFLKKEVLNRNPRIRLGTIMALGEIGPDAKDALEEVNSLRDKDLPAIRQAAREASKRIQLTKPSAAK